MNLRFDEGKLFYDLYPALLSFVNGKLKVSTRTFSGAEGYVATPPEARLAIRDALFAHRELIDEFVKENPAKLGADDLELVASWKYAVAGKFYIFRYLTKYTVFLSSGESPNKAYGVLGLADPLQQVVGPYLPRLIETALLPFRNRIIYDGLISGYNITFGGGAKRMLNEEYQRAKEVFGIITALPFGGGEPATAEKNETVPEAATSRGTRSGGRRPRKAVAGGSTSPAAIQTVLATLIAMTDSFCHQFLNEEYAESCRKLAEALARKRPSPLLRGRLETWACGIVRTIGWVNFLHDPSQTPHMTLISVDEAFGIAQSTGAARLKTIRTMLKIHQFDQRWTLPSKMDDNPMMWMLEVNGFLMDIRNAPRQLQELAFAKRLIPYLPADRPRAGEESPRK